MRSRRYAVAPLMALAIAACGGDGADDGIASLEGTAAPGNAPAAEVEIDAEEAVLAFTECLRVEGVPMPDPEFDDSGNLRMRSLMDLGEAFESFDRNDLEEAFGACSSHLQGVAQLFTSLDRSDFEDRMLDYAACMRENGYDMPDPDFGFTEGGPPGTGGDGSGVGPFGDLDTSDPAFQAANDACIAVFGETVGPDGFGPPVEPGG